jgi:AraC-like DNA-binding protein
MINNFNINILNGRVSRLTSNWSRTITGEEQYFKIYLPLAGEASLVINGKNEKIVPGYIYFISGDFLEKQICEDYIELVWGHFNLDILSFQVILKQSACFHSMPIENSALDIFDFSQFKSDVHSFDSADTENEIFPSPNLYFICKLSSLIYLLLGDIIKNINFTEMYSQLQVLNKFEEVLEYMDKNYLKNPSLQEVAKKANMAPNYFHRKFKKAFGISPYAYMLQKRMDKAKKLLAFPSRSIKEVALLCGYDNEFYFSKTFKKYSSMSPREFRAQSNKLS